MSAENSTLDFVTEAGPKAFSPLVSASVRLEIAKSSSLGIYKEVLKETAQQEWEQIKREIAIIGKENRENNFKAVPGMGTLHARFPLGLVLKFCAMYGDECWPDEEFMEDILKHHPELRVKTKYGTRGQEYVNGRK